MSNADLASPDASAEQERLRKHQRRARYNRVMKLVRRAHLYAGLFMTPWVFLYGITALLFNHPDAFPDSKVVRFAAEEGSSTSLVSTPRPAELAERVVAEVNRHSRTGEEELGYRLVRPNEARYARDYFASLQGDGQEHIVRIDLATGAGSVRTQQKSAGEPTPFVIKGGLKLKPSPVEGVTRALPALLDRLGVSGDKTVGRSLTPDLSFLMERQGTTWVVTYNAQTGQISGRRERDRSPLTARSYLLRLHLAHEYPSEVNARWFWAVAVDAMFVSMVGWGVTGLLMWWQMKNVRRVGILVLIASAVASAAVALGMHRLLTG